ncbi:hypothetical protein [Caulobacter sp. LARHSG274]
MSTPRPGDRLVAAIETQTVAIDRAMIKAFRVQLVGLTLIMAVARTAFVIVVKAG